MTASLFYDEESSTSHFIAGIVEEFYELDGANDWKAIFSVSITLSAEHDFGAKEEICYQKTYRGEKKCRRKNPRSLAEAMSGAISNVSKTIILDVRDHLKNKTKPARD